VGVEKAVNIEILIRRVKMEEHELLINNKFERWEKEWKIDDT
jgi:hypothetical protein